jgi:hypothetical protein
VPKDLLKEIVLAETERIAREKGSLGPEGYQIPWRDLEPELLKSPRVSRAIELVRRYDSDRKVDAFNTN